LEFASAHLDQFGPDDIREMQDDAVRCAVHDQLSAGLDVITDGEQTRLDFNLSFYGYLSGIDCETAPARRFGPPAHDQRGRHAIAGELSAPRGLGVVEEFQRLRRLVPRDCTAVLKASVPGPYTLSGRLIPNERYPDRWAITEALLPLVAAELEALVTVGCGEICVDEPSMSCYGWREDPERFADIFNRTVSGVHRRCRLSTHLCFGSYKRRAVAPRAYAPLFPAFLALKVDEIHLEMANREFAEIEIIRQIVETGKHAAVGIIDVKNYYVETPEEVVRRVKLCLRHAPSEALSFAPDCGFSQTARWAAYQKLVNLVAGVRSLT
jgi:5-methyltetrahydropteroyltriglutamate--homocysteine methyltransferase